MGGIADEHPTEKLAPVFSQYELLVDPFVSILIHNGRDTGRIQERITKSGDVRAEQLELGRQVAAPKLHILTSEVFRQRGRHVVAGRNESVDHPLMQRHLADGVHVGVTGAQAIVHEHATALADGNARRARELVARADSGRHNDHIDADVAPVGKFDRFDVSIAANRRDSLIQVNMDALRANRRFQKPRSGRVELPGHETWRHLDNVGLQARIEDCAGSFEPQKASANHSSAARCL